MFASADQGAVDKKFEGYSNLKGAHDQQQKKIQKGQQQEVTKGLEEEYILNLQKQIVLMEHEIKLLKDREVDQKNKASGYETLLRDGIPLNEHFLALKNKFNNEQDMLKKSVALMEEEIKMEDRQNVEHNKKIEILKLEYEQISNKFKNYKEATHEQMKDLERKLFTEQHTKDLLTGEKQVLYDKVSTLKNVNQNMGRQITKDKYHNNREEIDKQRTREIQEVQEKINKLHDEVEKQTAVFEFEQERNRDSENVLKRQKEVTMNLKQDHTRMKTDIDVANNRISNLTTRQDILND